MENRKQWFASQFRTGKRWVVLNLLDTGFADSGCYEDYQDAAEDCRNRNAHGGRCGVRVLASLLKELNRGSLRQYSNEKIENLHVVFGRYPLRPFRAGVNWELELLCGNYYPLIWERLADPLMHSRKFVILRELVSGPAKFEVLGCADDFPKAMMLFYHHAGSIRDMEVSLVLAGQFLEGTIEYNKRAFEEARVPSRYIGCSGRMRPGRKFWRYMIRVFLYSARLLCLRVMTHLKEILVFTMAG